MESFGVLACDVIVTFVVINSYLLLILTLVFALYSVLFSFDLVLCNDNCDVFCNRYSQELRK